MAEKIALTEERIRSFAAPAVGERFLWDAKVPGFGVRCFPSGRKVYVLMYRVRGGGRNATRQRITIGEVGKLPLGEARSIAQDHNGQIARGADPRAELREKARQKAATLSAAIEKYGRDLEQRGVANRDQVLSSLKRGMPQPLEKVDLAGLDRRTIAERIDKLSVGSRVDVATRTKAGKAIRRVGGPVAASQFRTFAHTFFEWCVAKGLMPANPLAGWRRPRATRAQRLARPGRALPTRELKAVWRACDLVAAPYGDFIRALVVLGQRRSETAVMRWSDLDRGQARWTIPAGVTKNGREHVVPLSDLALQIIFRQPRCVGSEYVFSGRGGVPISGWTKRHQALVKVAGVAFKRHDLRKTFRTGLTRLGVDPDVAELAINHVRSELLEIYDREPRMKERTAAMQAWADHVRSILPPQAHRSNVCADGAGYAGACMTDTANSSNVSPRDLLRRR